MKHVILVNLGTPDSPDSAAVRRYLAEFLADKRVVEAPRLIWWLVLNAIILPFRPARVAKLYQSIWTEQGSPIKTITDSLAQSMQADFDAKGKNIRVHWAMTYGQPSLKAKLDQINEEDGQEIIILPLYPQYSASTTAAVTDIVSRWALEQRKLPSISWIADYYDDEGYIQALADSILASWEKNGRSQKLLMSFHGIPQEYADKGDPYPKHCFATAKCLAQKLNLSEEQYIVSFQSRFGPKAWLQPYTDKTLEALAAEGLESIDVICPGFSADCLETLEEIEEENKECFISAGGKQFQYIPALNDSQDHVRALVEIIEKKFQI